MHSEGGTPGWEERYTQRWQQQIALLRAKDRSSTPVAVEVSLSLYIYIAIRSRLSPVRVLVLYSPALMELFSLAFLLGLENRP
jgi:hypothetical protein